MLQGGYTDTTILLVDLKILRTLLKIKDLETLK